MTTAPRWEPVDDETADLLSLVATGPMSPPTAEWDYFVEALYDSARCRPPLGVINPNVLRRQVRGIVAPQRIGAFTNRALSQGLVEYTGEWIVSDDAEGRNSGKPCRVMRWIGGEL